MTPEEPEGDLPALRLGAVALVGLCGTWALLANADDVPAGLASFTVPALVAFPGPMLAGLACAWPRPQRNFS